MPYQQIKQTLLSQLQSQLQAMIVQAKQSAQDAQQEANYHIGAMASRYDTFKEEAQYLSEAQKIRLRALQVQLQDCEQLQAQLCGPNYTANNLKLGALAQLVSEASKEYWVFIAPVGLNLQLETDLGKVICVTPEAPLVKNGIGLGEGEEYEVPMANGSTWYEVAQLV